MDYKRILPERIVNNYEIYDYKHALTILKYDFNEQYYDLIRALGSFELSVDDIIKPGGNESDIPKKISGVLRPLGWVEDTLHSQRVVDGEPVNEDTHKIDYVKGRVAFDLEWNSKDQTFDRDLYAFRTFWDYNRISLGVLLTRSTSLHEKFKTLGNYTDKHGRTSAIFKKYGASTTHINKLLPRLDAGRNGGCPVLVFGITEKLITNG
jgi:hypothetical protein